VIEGHTAGASEKKLAAYLSAGVTSCHEPIDAEQVLARLRLGVHVMIREGSIRRDLEAISAIRQSGIDRRRLVLASDGASPQDLIQGKYMDFVVRKAMACGFAPVEAIQMATLNVPSISVWTGFWAESRPGGWPIWYWSGSGRVHARDGHLQRRGHLRKRPAPQNAPAACLLRSEPEHRQAAPPLAAFRFHHPRAYGAASARVRVIEMLTDLVTAERHLDLSLSNAAVEADPAGGLCKIAAVDRAHNPGKLFTGLIKDFGLKAGAVACSAAWDTSDIVVVGASSKDMACAVNRLGELQGGVALCEGGQVRAEIPMPIFGLACDLPVPELAARLEALKQAIARLGVTFPDPLLSLITLTGAAIPYLRICEEGLVNLKDGKTLGLFVS